MRKLFPLLATGWWFVTGFSCALAQEATPAPPAPQAEPTPAAPEPPPYSLDLPELHPPGNGGGLFPNNPRQNPPATTSSRTGRTRRNPLDSGSKRRGRSLDRTLQQADADPLTVRVAYRRDKTVVLARDPELAVLLRRADEADTDVKKRAFLREYYTRLFTAVRRLDSSPGMKQHLTLLAQVAEQRYDPKRRVVATEEDLLNTRETSGNQRLGR